MPRRTLSIIADVNYTLLLLSFPLLGSEKYPTVTNAAEVTTEQPRVSAGLFNQRRPRAFGANVGCAYVVFPRAWGAGSGAERIAGSHVV